MPYFIRDYWTGQDHPIAADVYVSDKPRTSNLLGPDGKPLQYQTFSVGFDLRPTQATNHVGNIK